MPRRPRSHLSTASLAIAACAALAACADDAAPPAPVTVAARGGALFVHPLDAAASDDGRDFFFVASDAEGGAPGLYHVAAQGGSARRVWRGAPLAEPRGLVVRGSAAGGDLAVWVADTEAGVLAFAAPDTAAAPIVVPGTAALAPSALDHDGAALVVVGVDGDAPAIVRLADGVAPEVLARGAPLVAPGGVAVAPDGVIFVADAAAGEGGRGALLRLQGGAAEVSLGGLTLGDPPGVAVTRDGGTVLLSALGAATGTSQVVFFARDSGDAFAVDVVIGDNETSGGLHRAADDDLFAWAGVGKGQDRGAVYRVVGALFGDVGGAIDTCRDAVSGEVIACP